MPFFDGSQKKIGQGAQAVVYLYKGCAYKVYREDYPKEWIQGELMTQREIVKTGLPVVHYAKTEAPNILKMDYIDGITLGDQMLAGSAPNSLQEMCIRDRPYVMGGGTYARKLPRAFAFGPSMPGDSKEHSMFPAGHGGGHEPDECLKLSSLFEAMKIYCMGLIALDDYEL